MTTLAPQETAALAAALAAALSPSRVSQGESERLIYARDMWPRTLLALRDNRPLIAPPDFVVWPESAKEIAEVLCIAAEHHVAVVPWGAGSGVCGGAMTIKGGIALDLKRMSAVLSVDATERLATFQSGVLGQILEDQLNVRGLTLGHFPSSIYCSTLGGWLAARSAGQCSSLYGKIEDMVEELEVVTGDGQTIHCTAHEFPDILQLVVGSEGTLGVITQATMRVHRLPETRVFRAYRFPRLAAGAEGIRRVMQRGLRPSVLRLYDELDSLIASIGDESGDQRTAVSSLLALVLGGGKHDDEGEAATPREESRGSAFKKRLLKGMLARAGLLNRLGDALLPHLSSGCLLIIGHEGTAALAETEAALSHAELLAAGGRDLGDGPGLRWYEHRHAVSYRQSPLYMAGGFVDTMEVATTWSRLLELYTQVKQAISPLAVVMAHFSHAYPEGCSIYFTFAAAAEPRGRAERLYDDIWRRGLSAVVRAGGTISHHHGVGFSKASFMAEEHGHGIEIFRQLKQALDPHGVLNPGKMGL